MIITISGKPGSGKNTVADILANDLNLKRYSVGDFRREMAKKRGYSLSELNKLGEKEAFTDNDADDWQVEIGKNENNFIIDGRLSYHFIPNSIKLFLDVAPEIGAKRIMLHNRKEESFSNLEEAINMWNARVNSDLVRYAKYYNLNPYDTSQYDFVLDTGKISPSEVVEEIKSYIYNSFSNLKV